jgi:hypothetical protein
MGYAARAHTCLALSPFDAQSTHVHGATREAATRPSNDRLQLAQTMRIRAT